MFLLSDTPDIVAAGLSITAEIALVEIHEPSVGGVERAGSRRPIAVRLNIRYF